MRIRHLDFGQARETLAVCLIALFIGLAVYVLLGLAWTFKSTVEAAEKLRHSLSRPF